MFGSDVLDVFKDDAVAECLLSRGESFPILSDIDDVALVNRNDPVIREVLVDDLPHFGVLLLQDLGAEGEQDEDDLRLIAERDGPVFGVWICGKLVVDVVIFQRVYEHLD